MSVSVWRILPLVRDGRRWYAEGVAGRESHDARPVGHDDVPFGARLRRLRQDAGLTQEELASKAGLSARAISSLERGERKHPHPHTVRSLADALGLADDERVSLLAAVPGRGGTAPATAPPESDLPTPATPLLGREKELREVRTFLGGVRLLTLTGTGGVGKTRLALEAARAVLAEGLFLPADVAFVALAPLEDPTLVVPSMARSLGLREAEGQTLEEALRARLRGRRTLHVLDNFEHVLDAASEVARLLESCPGATILATSRAPLRVRGEQEYPVPPLRLPTSTLSPDVRSVLRSPAGGLFVERAKAASPSFEVTGENAADVAAICWRLAGLPLALELAAARVRFLDPVALLSRLDRALSAGWARDLPERHRTMRSTLDWSHDLLSQEERVLFRRLSVFAGGFTLEAAEAVGAAGEAGPEDALTLLGELAEQSLVTAQPPADGASGARYGMLEPVRQYAREKLEESGEARAIRGKHATYYLALAERAHPELQTARQVEWLGRLDREYGNLRAAMSWALSEGEAEIATRLGWALWLFWWVRGHQAEGRRCMETLLERHAPADQRTVALAVAGTMAYTQGDFEACEKFFVEGVGLARRLDDTPRLAHQVQGLGLLALERSNPGEAAARFEEALGLYLAAGGNDQMVSFVRTQLGTVLLLRGDHDRAAEMMEEGLAVARRVGDRTSTYVALYNLAQVALARDDLASAASLLREGVTLSREMRDRANLAHFSEGLAVVTEGRGESERSARLFGVAEGLLEEVGAPVYNYYLPDRALYDKTRTAVRSGLGEESFEEARNEGREMGFEQAVAYALGDDAASRV